MPLKVPGHSTDKVDKGSVLTKVVCLYAAEREGKIKRKDKVTGKLSSDIKCYAEHCQHRVTGMGRPVPSDWGSESAAPSQ